jgi:hypothetical protein
VSHLAFFGTVNLSLRASYSHGDSGPLHMDLVVMAPINTLKGV